MEQPRYLNTSIGIDPPALPLGDYHSDTPLEEYDLNFCWPVKALEGSGVRLEPFIVRSADQQSRTILDVTNAVQQPSVHAQALHAALLKDDPDQKVIFRYESRVLPPTLAHLLTAAESWRRLPGLCVFAILDMSRPYADSKPCGGRIAGYIGLRADSPASDFSAEVGPVVILPRAQRT